MGGVYACTGERGGGAQTGGKCVEVLGRASEVVGRTRARLVLAALPPLGLGSTFLKAGHHILSIWSFRLLNPFGMSVKSIHDCE